MRHCHRLTRLPKRNTSRSKIWQEMDGFCSRDEFTPSFMTQSWMQRDVRESFRSTRTISLHSKRQFTWYLSTLVWLSLPNRRPPGLAVKT